MKLFYILENKVNRRFFYLLFILVNSSYTSVCSYILNVVSINKLAFSFNLIIFYVKIQWDPLDFWILDYVEE